MNNIETYPTFLSSNVAFILNYARISEALQHSIDKKWFLSA